MNSQVERISKNEEYLKIVKLGTELNGPMAHHDCWTGFFNDMFNLYRESIPFEKVKVPTLILHGDADGDVNFSNA